MHRVLTATIVLVAAVAIAACSAGSTTAVRTVEADEAVALLGTRTIIDVRTPAETAHGTIAGAITIDFQAGDFRERVAELERDGSYLVYCRSGNRSAQAAAVMAELGFTDVVDGGGFDALVAAGAPIGP
jgi:rhodanese-related sulfurtransferase